MWITIGFIYGITTAIATRWFAANATYNTGRSTLGDTLKSCLLGVIWPLSFCVFYSAAFILIKVAEAYAKAQASKGGEGCK